MHHKTKLYGAFSLFISRLMIAVLILPYRHFAKTPGYFTLFLLNINNIRLNSVSSFG